MKKITVLLLAGVLTLGICGCGKTEVPIETETASPTTASTLIEVQGEEENPFATMSYDDLWALSIGDFKQMVIHYVPTYRELFGIETAEDSLTDEDWEEIRELFSFYMFGKGENIENSGVPSTDVIDTSNENWIYETPTYQYIEGLTTDEFREYIKKSLIYEYGEETVSEIDFANLSDEELEFMREELLSELEDYKDVSAPVSGEEESTETITVEQ